MSACGAALQPRAGILWLADGGALRCRSAHSLHVLPPTLALWVPQDVPHEVEGLGGAQLRRVGLALPAGVVCATAPASCRVTVAGPLLAALADTLDGTNGERPVTPRQQLGLALAAEEVQSAEPLPIGVALPHSPTLRRACEAALRDGAGDCNLQALAEAANTSMRTLARCFQKELALPFSHWRLQLRLARLVALWAEGRTLSASAAAVGYTSPSALSFRVRRLIGMTPSRLLAERAGAGANPIAPRLSTTAY
ncbi:AraC family transcriptional regulator [Ideonella sp.]|uniref:AraC family transcriptional regulator n=1 Tax=Ideonella sp. TaxID=1929293 RepID=UPI002B49F703|nr:AraC family transcriptional regulator [Ideonella sp.]HJV71463.1 AraC family transcriptional regulator [Ideonella sp.]